jgi:hypothetical protein
VPLVLGCGVSDSWIVMSLSWNFVAQAKPKYKGFEPIYFMFNFMNLYKRISIFGEENYDLGTQFNFFQTY